MFYTTAITYHALFLSVQVGGLASDNFLYVILAIEHSLNLYLLISIWKKKQNTSEESRKEIAMDAQLLVLAEILEIVIPLAYLACYVLAYYGPNADILGNVKNDYWQFQKVDDIMIPINNLLFLVIVDTISFIVVLIFLFLTCKINLLQVFVYMMNEYGMTFTAHIAYFLEMHFCAVTIACANDITLAFDWVFDQGKWQNITGIYNQSEIIT